jgi:hypothetical protein
MRLIAGAPNEEAVAIHLRVVDDTPRLHDGYPSIFDRFKGCASLG